MIFKLYLISFTENITYRIRRKFAKFNKFLLALMRQKRKKSTKSSTHYRTTSLRSIPYRSCNLSASTLPHRIAKSFTEFRNASTFFCGRQSNPTTFSGTNPTN